MGLRDSYPFVAQTGEPSDIPPAWWETPPAQEAHREEQGRDRRPILR